MNTPTNRRQSPAKQPAAGTNNPLLAYRCEIEGSYWGRSQSGNIAPKPYNIVMIVPANYNAGGRGNTYLKKALLGKINGVPYLRTYKDAKGEMPYADYSQLRTHNLVDWQEVYDAETAGDMVKEKTVEEMNADELKAALTRLGITYKNPARKSELVEQLKEAMAANVQPVGEEADRPNFANNLDKNIDDVPVGTMVDTSIPDSNNPLLPRETDKVVDTFVS